MEKVIIPKRGRYKCVILSNDVNSVFRADYGDFHEEVAKITRKKEPQLSEYKVLGGGRVLIVDKTIEVYGYSVDYGQMDKDLVEELVSEYAKINGLTLINNTGEGY